MENRRTASCTAICETATTEVRHHLLPDIFDTFSLQFSNTDSRVIEGR